MRISKLLIPGCLVGLFLMTASTSTEQKSNDIQGSWTLIKYKYGNDKYFSDVPSIITYVKHITDTHYSWASYGEDGSLIFAGGGTYELSEGIYRENIDYFHPIGSSLPGTHIDFNYSIEGNNWTILGYGKSVQLNPGSGKYESIDSSRLEEVWRRL